MLIASSGFVAMGIWIILEADNLTCWRAISPFFALLIGIAAILFFGLGIILGIKRLIKSEISLIIDPIGLNVNPKKLLTEFINWDEIIGFEEIKIQSSRFVIIEVNNPESWLEKDTNIIRKRLMQFNINNYNSPFNIASAGLNISSDEER